jgi:hypothetical protein
MLSGLVTHQSLVSNGRPELGVPQEQRLAVVLDVFQRSEADLTASLQVAFCVVDADVLAGFCKKQDIPGGVS